MAGKTQPGPGTVATPSIWIWRVGEVGGGGGMQMEPPVSRHAGKGLSDLNTRVTLNFEFP